MGPRRHRRHIRLRRGRHVYELEHHERHVGARADERSERRADRLADRLADRRAHARDFGARADERAAGVRVRSSGPVRPSPRLFRPATPRDRSVRGGVAIGACMGLFAACAIAALVAVRSGSRGGGVAARDGGDTLDVNSSHDGYTLVDMHSGEATGPRTHDDGDDDGELPAFVRALRSSAAPSFVVDPRSLQIRIWSTGMSDATGLDAEGETLDRLPFVPAAAGERICAAVASVPRQQDDAVTPLVLSIATSTGAPCLLAMSASCIATARGARFVLVQGRAHDPSLARLIHEAGDEYSSLANSDDRADPPPPPGAEPPDGRVADFGRRRGRRFLRRRACRRATASPSPRTARASHRAPSRARRRNQADDLVARDLEDGTPPRCRRARRAQPPLRRAPAAAGAPRDMPPFAARGADIPRQRARGRRRVRRHAPRRGRRDRPDARVAIVGARARWCAGVVGARSAAARG